MTDLLCTGQTLTVTSFWSVICCLLPVIIATVVPRWCTRVEYFMSKYQAKCSQLICIIVHFIALMLLIGWKERSLACKSWTSNSWYFLGHNWQIFADWWKNQLFPWKTCPGINSFLPSKMKYCYSLFYILYNTICCSFKIFVYVQGHTDTVTVILTLIHDYYSVSDMHTELLSITSVILMTVFDPWRCVEHNVYC